MFIKINVKRSL